MLSISCRLTQSDQKLSTRRQILKNFLDINGEPKELFKVFHFLYKKNYEINSETALKKYKTFKENVQKIKEHNAKGLTWWKSINEHTDLTIEEFNKHFNIKTVSHEEMKASFAGAEKFLAKKEFNFDEMADMEDKKVEKKNLNMMLLLI